MEQEKNMGRGTSKAGRTSGGAGAVVQDAQMRINREKSSVGLESTMSYIRNSKDYENLDNNSRGKIENLYVRRAKILNKEAEKNRGWNAEGEKYMTTRRGKKIWDR